MDRGFAIDALFNPAVLFTLGLVLLPLGVIALSILSTWAAPDSDEPETSSGAQAFGVGAVASGEHQVVAQVKVYDANAEQPAMSSGAASTVQQP